MSENLMPWDMLDSPVAISTKHVAERVCPGCGEDSSGVTAERIPQEHDVCVCFHCGHASVLGPNLEHAALDVTTLPQALQDEIVACQALIRGGHTAKTPR